MAEKRLRMVGRRKILKVRKDWKLWRAMNLILTSNIEGKMTAGKQRETYLIIMCKWMEEFSLGGMVVNKTNSDIQ